MDHLKRAAYFLERGQNAFYKKIADLHSDFEDVSDYLLLEFNIKPLLIGGLAVQHYGFERQTVDIDILLSKTDYQKLLKENKIKYGTLKFKPNIQIDVLSEGKDNNPNPETIRDGNSNYPTLEGLIYLKLISNRLKDQSDIVELLKINGLTEELQQRVYNFLPSKRKQQFLELWNKATKEQKKAKRFREE